MRRKYPEHGIFPRIFLFAPRLAHSIYNLRNQDFGFDPENREIVTIEPPLVHPD